VALAEEANEPGWWQRYHDVLPDWFSMHVSLEGAARMIRSYEPHFVPGLLQTEEYARAVLEAGTVGQTGAEAIDRHVALRMKRQTLLTRENPPHLWVIMDETALLRPVSIRGEVMRDQMDRLLEWVELDHVTLQVAEFAAVCGGRRMFGPSFDRTKLDNLTLGLDRRAARHLPKIPLAIARLSGSRRVTARLSSTYDAVLMPTLAEDTPRIGHFDPTADYDQVMDRLLEWVAFTPLQNVTGDPSISLPLVESAAGLPVGMMLSTVVGQEARLLELAYELEEARPWARIQS